MQAIQSDEMAAAIAEHYRALANPDHTAKEAAALRKKIAGGEKTIGAITRRLGDTSAPDALLRQIEALEAEREAAVGQLAAMESRASEVRAMRSITPGMVHAMLDRLADDIGVAPPEALKDALAGIVERIELSPETFEAAITYRIAPASKPASRWRPHGDSCFAPVFTRTDRFTARHNRRAA